MARNPTVVKKTPRAWVTYSYPVKRRDRLNLRRILYNGLRNGPYRTVETRFPWPSVDVEISGNTFGIKIDRYRRDKDSLCVSVFPIVSAFFYFQEASVPGDFIRSLPELCNTVHQVLRSAPDVKSVCWYFYWKGYMTGAVWTPDELPWAR